MNIGFLDRRIIIEVPSASPTKNAYGETTESDAWTTYGTVWAAMDNKAARSSVIQEQETAINGVTWRVRSSALTRLVTPKYRIKYGTDYYNILAVQEVGRKDMIYFVTERVISE